MTHFLEAQPTAQNRWRALILLGRNTASYKFALGRALLSLMDQADDLVRLEELALPFARALSEHIKDAPRQGTTGINRRLREALEGYNQGTLQEDRLRDITVRHGFSDVIDAFHVLGREPITERFFVDERKTARGIRITDELRRLTELRHPADLIAETEARWRVVETGWELGVSAGLIEYKAESGALSIRSPERRIALRSCRSTLNGYQKGACFYCFAPISIEPGAELADVDHFFPWSRRSEFTHADGIWNLVLACPSCNRGVGGKFDQVPGLELLARLHRRNEFYVDSKHPLAGTILAQTGASQLARRSFLQGVYDALAISAALGWMPRQRAERAF